jgi:hypothetical protein
MNKHLTASGLAVLMVYAVFVLAAMFSDGFRSVVDQWLGGNVLKAIVGAWAADLGTGARDNLVTFVSWASIALFLHLARTAVGIALGYASGSDASGEAEIPFPSGKALVWILISVSGTLTLLSFVVYRWLIQDHRPINAGWFRAASIALLAFLSAGYLFDQISYLLRLKPGSKRAGELPR